MRVVAALGGNALLRRDERLDHATQRRNAAAAAIGYVLAQELMNALPGRSMATLLTQTVVAADDPRLIELWTKRGVEGVEAVVDKDLTAATPDELAALDLPAGSIGPKAQAAAAFATRTSRRAAIGSLADAPALVAGRAGTQVRMPGVRASMRSSSP